ncbi:uracil phosphoribosyltransferase [Litoribacter ruber]|uniref:Uracil phosphoribosyltransferase n=1 Tax=Litoribacter ruber TaxID=702568 RepID=A0AAP2G0B7_9BACT|nr:MULTISPECIES: uracil phosphoribosyltransferase [Litoribacter]MBS9522469.1 uracil phosphoribosyltransferase [Litoribacter alkaliphilus]MBT0810989.1 uracil phosphoribosyltransferase [Litoribacter ruber]
MFILNQTTSIANQFLADLRNIDRQQDRMRFRRNLERLGEIMAYEVSKSLTFESHTITTPLAQTEVKRLTDNPVVISVMRAAIPFYQGFINYFDDADSGFIGAYRREAEGQDLEIDLDYLAAPSIEGKEVLIVDPMLATGGSLLTSIKHLLVNGTPKKLHIISAIAAPEGIEHVKNNLDLPHEFWLCALDERLNEKSYIVPGLGDAGDLAFGQKL